MNTIRIEKIDLGSIDELLKISRETFLDTFSDSNTQENMDKYLEENLTLPKLTQEIQNPDSQFYFAVSGDETIGYLKLNSGNAQTEQTDGNALEIERIYVTKEYQGKKIGQLLFAKAVEIARVSGASYLWLGVWEENHKAIRFYEKNGLVVFDRHPFWLGNDKQTDIMMKLVFD